MRKHMKGHLKEEMVYHSQIQARVIMDFKTKAEEQQKACEELMARMKTTEMWSTTLERKQKSLESEVERSKGSGEMDG